MVEMLLGGNALQHWQQFKSQATALPILGVLDKDKEESSEDDEDDEEKEKKDKGQSSASAVPPADITKETYSSICREDPEALSLELSPKTKGSGNSACGSLATRDQ
eukprot:484658-Ditylum_brightwellii.AAC.1